IHALRGVGDVYIPQDLDYPALRLEVDRQRASQLGLSQKEVIHNVITALTSNGMIAPSYWIDPRTGNDYMLTVQYPEQRLQTVMDLTSIPLRGPDAIRPTMLSEVSKLSRSDSPTEIDHYQIQRTIDVYVTPSGEDLGRVAKDIDRILASSHLPTGVRVELRGMVESMRASFRSFGLGL